MAVSLCTFAHIVAFNAWAVSVRFLASALAVSQSFLVCTSAASIAVASMPAECSAATAVSTFVTLAQAAAEAAVARATQAVLRSNGDVGRNYLVDDPPDLLMYHEYGGANTRLRRPDAFVRAYREQIRAYGFDQSQI